MRTVHRRIFSPAKLLTLAGVGALLATGAQAQTPSVSVRGRIQTQFSTVSGDSSGIFNPHAQVNSSFEIRRLRIQTDVRIGDNINLVIQPSFEMSALRMRDAYLRVILARNATTSFGLTLGQEKKPFNRYELTSSNNLLSIERGARFRGLSTVVAQNNLLEENGYLAHDIGASADLNLLSNRFTLKAGMYNGSGESSNDVNNAKTYGARATFTALLNAEQLPVLRVGAAFMSRDRAITTTSSSTVFSPDSSRRTAAFGLEAEWGDFRPGLHVIADFATGKALTNATYRYTVGRNAGNLRPNAPDSAFSTFRSLQVIAAWRYQFDDPNGTRLVKIVEPALRLDMTDPNTSLDNDQGLLITPVLNVYFSQTTVMRAGLDLYRYHAADGSSRKVNAFRLSWQTNF
jgi:hypothetical protein